MSTTIPATLETVLARLYVDAEARARFLADPWAESQRHGLSPEDADALARIDRVGLVMAANSYAAKRAHHRRTKPTFTDLFRRFWRGLRK